MINGHDNLDLIGPIIKYNINLGHIIWLSSEGLEKRKNWWKKTDKSSGTLLIRPWYLRVGTGISRAPRWTFCGNCTFWRYNWSRQPIKVLSDKTGRLVIVGGRANADLALFSIRGAIWLPHYRYSGFGDGAAVLLVFNTQTVHLHKFKSLFQMLTL